MSDYEDDSVMQNGSDDQPTRSRDPLDDEEEEEDDQPPRRSRYEDDEEEEEEGEEGDEGPGDNRAKKKAKVRALSRIRSNCTHVYLVLEAPQKVLR